MVDSIPKNIKIVKMPKKYEASYVLEDSFDRILLLFDFKIFEEITNQTSLKTIFTNQPIQTPFNYQIRELSAYESLKITSIIISNEKMPCEIEMNLNFKANTLDNTTLLTLEIKLVNTKFTNEHNLNKIVKGCQNLCIEYIRGIERYLEQRLEFAYQNESIIIKVNKERIFDYFVHSKMIDFYEGVNIIVPNEENLKVGSKFYFFYKCLGIKIENTIIKMDNDPKKNKWCIKFSCNSELFKTQDIHIYLIDLEGGSTFFSLIHKFKESIQFEQIQEIERKKKILLIRIKDFFENENNNSTNETNNISNNMSEQNDDLLERRSLKDDLFQNLSNIK